MRQPSEPLPQSQFAGLLATLAGPAPSEPAPWADEALEDDVAVLSYEQALRAQTSRQAAAAPAPPARSESSQKQGAPSSCAKAATDSIPTPAVTPRSASAQELKKASVTVRMSQAECAQLHQRAAEAGLTISAYLRSCAFEVESLRSLVKETMAKLREANANQKAPAAGPNLPFHHRLVRWFAPGKGMRIFAR